MTNLRTYLLLALWLVVMDVSYAGAQRPDFCWRNPRPECNVTLVTEVHVDAVLASSTRNVRETFGEQPRIRKEEGIRGFGLGWDAGILWRIDSRRAVGMALEVGVTDGELRTALKARARQYVSESVSLELAAGWLRDARGLPPSTGFTVNARANVADKFALYLTYDDMSWAPSQSGFEEALDTTRARGVRGGVAIGSLPAVAGTAVGAAAWLVLLALILSSGAGY